MNCCKICELFFKYSVSYANIFIKSIIIPKRNSLDVQLGQKIEFNNNICVCKDCYEKHKPLTTKPIKKQTMFSKVWKSLKGI